jgi:hypothetical protein
MKVAIVTPFHAEPLIQLAHCIRSVGQQEQGLEHFQLEHVLVADGGDVGLAVDAMKVSGIPTVCFPRVLSLPVAHADFGNCARAVGALDAVARGFDAVGFLDADNWIERAHVERMVALHRATGAPICTASRMICRVNGSPMFADKESDGDLHTDTSCLFVTREAFRLLPFWAFIPRSAAAIGDRVFWTMVRNSHGLERAHCRLRTVNYRTRYAVHYRAINEEPPPEAKENPPPPGGVMLQPVLLRVPGPA